MSDLHLFLNGLIDRARTDYRHHVGRLTAVIPDKRLAMGLVENADVHGIDATLAHMCAHPENLGLSRNSPLLSLQTQSTLAHILDSVLASQLRLTEAVKHREQELRKNDPGRLPVYVIDGREMSLDYENGRLIPIEPAKPSRRSPGGR